MITNILSLSQKLISIPSISQDKNALGEVLQIALSYLSEYTIEHFEEDGVKSALVYNTPKRPKKFKILLNAHLDVVPGNKSQYTPRVVNNKLYGIGALDMKSNAATLIVVFKELAKSLDYPLAIQLVTDEELGGFNGTKHQVKQGVKADFVIAGETTNFDIVNKAKGILWLKIISRGKTAHGAYPWRGENAIWKMNKFLTLLAEKFPNPKDEKWVTTINLANIHTNNQSFNKIPDRCEVLLDIRYIPEDTEKILDAIRKLLPEDFTLEVLVKEPAMYVYEKNSYIQELKKASEKIVHKKIILRGANGSSDARHFTKIGINGIEFGAIGGGIGSDSEYIDIPSLEHYKEILKEFLLSLS